MQFFVTVSIVNINYAVKHLLVFWRSRTDTVKLEIFLSLEHCCFIVDTTFCQFVLS